MNKTIYKLKENPSLSDLQEITRVIYGIPNDRFFNTWEITSNQEKFMMRAIKGIRKGDVEKIKTNLAITTGWFLSLMNRLHINIEEAVWNRFPYLCSYCGHSPCVCKKTKPTVRPEIVKDELKHPLTLKELQLMFEKIYPANTRTLEHSGIHLAEEDGELSEALQIYAGSHNPKYFKEIVSEAADYFSCIMGVYNSVGLDFQEEMKKFYEHNCHACHKAPCNCNFRLISEFKS